MTTPVDARMAQRYDTPANWAAENPVLEPGEFGVEDTGKFKVGDGVTPWNGLPYYQSDATGSFYLF